MRHRKLLLRLMRLGSYLTARSVVLRHRSVLWMQWCCRRCLHQVVGPPGLCRCRQRAPGGSASTFCVGSFGRGRKGAEPARGPLYCVGARAVYVRSEAFLQARAGRAGCLLAINHDACACPVLSGEPSATYARFCHRPAGEGTKFIHPRTFCPHSTAPPTANMAIQKKVRMETESLRL
jgi:hypothetical protein